MLKVNQISLPPQCSCSRDIKDFSRALRFYRIMGGEPQGSTWIAWLNQSMNSETFRLVSKAFLWLYPIIRLQEHLGV